MGWHCLSFRQLLTKRNFTLLQTREPIRFPKRQHTFVVGARVQHKQELPISPQEPSECLDEVAVSGRYIERSPAFGGLSLWTVDARRKDV
jgi:hypothetical protein